MYDRSNAPAIDVPDDPIACLYEAARDGMYNFVGTAGQLCCLAAEVVKVGARYEGPPLIGRRLRHRLALEDGPDDSAVHSQRGTIDCAGSLAANESN